MIYNKTKGMESKMKKIITAAFAAVMCAVMLFTGCGSQTIATKNDKELNETVVATIGDVKVSQADYNFIYKLLYDNMAQYSQYYGEDWINTEIEEGKTIGDYIKENTINQLKQIIAANIIAQEEGIKVDGDIKKAVSEQKEKIINDSYKGEKNYIAFLEETRTTDNAIDTYLQRYEVYNKLFEKLTAKGGKAYIEDTDIEKEFAEEYADKWRVQHILISTQEQTDDNGNKTPARSDEEAQKIVKEVIAKLDAGEDFDSLIEEYNEDPGMSKGNYYVFGTGEMVPEFEEASANLAVGEYTKEGVKTDYGYHIIKKYEINKEINEFKDFKNSKSEQKVMELVEKKMDSLKIKTEDKAIDKYVDSWLKEMAKQSAQNEAQSQAATSEQDETEHNHSEEEEKTE